MNENVVCPATPLTALTLNAACNVAPKFTVTVFDGAELPAALNAMTYIEYEPVVNPLSVTVVALAARSVTFAYAPPFEETYTDSPVSPG